MRDRNAAFWSAVAAELERSEIESLPTSLAFERAPVPDAIGPEVLLSQTCGYPLQTIYRGHFQLVGVPTYDAPGCGPGTHCAFILVRDDARFDTPRDLKGAIFGVNSRTRIQG